MLIEKFPLFSNVPSGACQSCKKRNDVDNWHGIKLVQSIADAPPAWRFDDSSVRHQLHQL